MTPSASRGWCKFVSLTELNDVSRRFIKDDTLTICAELEVHLVRDPEPAAPAKQEGYDEKLFLQPPPPASPCTICLCVMADPVSCPEGHKCD